MASELKKILKELFLVLVLCTFGGVAAGLILNSMENELYKIPGLLVLLPAVLAMRGNISGAIGSRLGSALHLGLIEPRFKWNPALVDNIWASLILNVVMSFLLGIVAAVAYFLFFPSDANLGILGLIIKLTTISLIAGTGAGIILTALSVFIAIATYSYGLDPDNVVNPILLTTGDILTVLCLLLTAKFFV